MAGIGTPALSSTGGGGSSTITSFLGSTTNAPMNITQIGGNAVTTTIPVSGTVTANAGTGTFTIQNNASVNIAQVGGASFALGQQLAGASLPIVLTAAQLTTLTPPSNTGYALDSSLTTIDTDLKSNITLHAGANIIGSVKVTDGTNTQTFMSTTTTSKFGADINILSILGTAPTTVGKLDVKGADGDVFVRQATAGNLNATVVGTGTFAVQATLAAETTKVIGTVNQGTSPWIVAGGGTAGTAATGVVTVQGIAGMTKLLVTPDANSAVNIAQINGVTPLMGNGATGTGSMRVTLATDNSALSTAGLFSVKIDQTTVGSTNAVTPVPASNSGWSFSYQSALSATKVQIKATAGTFGGYINLFNPNTATTFIQVFNKASANVTVGSTAPDFVITLPGIATASGTGSDRNLEITLGVAMNTGITIAATTTATGSTGPSSAVVGTFLFL